MVFYQDVPEVRSIVKLCYDLGLHQGQKQGDLSRRPDSNASMESGQASHTIKKYPFVVIEGLDGTGKESKLRMKHKFKIVILYFYLILLSIFFYANRKNNIDPLLIKTASDEINVNTSKEL